VSVPEGWSTAPVTPATARAHAFVEHLDRPALAHGDHHHLHRVLRLGPGDAVTVSDGRGRWRAGRLTDGTAVEPTGGVETEPAPAPLVTVAFALVKGGRPELVVQKLTELGVDRIIPFVAERSVVRWDGPKAARQHVRLDDIAREAAMQCRRVWLPRVDALATFSKVAALPGAALAEGGGQPPTLRHPTLLVGPEGGWAPAERALGLPQVALAEHTLRTETAAITAGALLVSLRGTLVSERVEPGRKT
jgi:16S rRNA (uracil1498-N3)-methyltransferase